VQVRGQASLVSEKTTSYAAPTLYSVTPASGPTAGSTVITLSGKDLGLISPNSTLAIRINSQATASNARPSDVVLAAYWDSVLAGGPSSGSDAAGSAVALWVASLAKPLAVSPLNTAGKNWTIRFQLPVGYGADLDLFVVVDGVPSNRLTFSYNPPVIYNLAPDRLNVSAGQLRLFVEGNNFCNFANGCGELYVNGERVLPPFLDIESWTDKSMMAIVDDPNKDGDKSRSSYVMILVAGRWSNNVSFSAPVPSFDALSGQGSWGASKTLVDSAEITFALELNGVPDSSLNDPTVTCALRSSIDASAGVTGTAIASFTAPSGETFPISSTDPLNTAICGRRRRLSDAKSSVQISHHRRLVGGTSISFTMDIAGSIKSSGGSLDPNSVSSLMSNVTGSLSGSSSILADAVQALAAAAGIDPSTITATVDPASVTSAVTKKVIPAGSTIPTTGGTRFFINNVQSIADTPTSDIKILIGGRFCSNITKFQDGDNGPLYQIPPSSPIAAQYLTFRLTCTVPPGVGANLPILISTGLGFSRDNPDFRFSYAAPTILDVVDDLTGNSILTPVLFDGTGRSVLGISTLGGRIRILGNNFGDSATVTTTSALTIPETFNLTITTSSGHVLRFPSNGIVSHDHSEIVLDFPAGQGYGIVASLSVGAQTDTDPQANGVSPDPTILRYADPTVDVVFNPVTLVTVLKSAVVACGCSTPGPLATFETAVAASNFARSTLATLVSNVNSVCPFTSTAPQCTPATMVSNTYASFVNLQLDSTAGGSPLCILGSNFGIATGSSVNVPVVSILLPTSTFTAVIPSSYTPASTHGLICTTLPEGWGKNIPVNVDVSGQKSAVVAGSAYTFAKPIVTTLRVSSSTVPTLGKTASGQQIFMTIYGFNFGLEGYVTFVPTVTSDVQITLTVPHSDMIVHNHTAMIFPVPQGLGYDLQVFANAGLQTNDPTPPLFFSYSIPVVTSISNAARTVEFCTPRSERILIRNNTFVNRLVYPTWPGCYPTAPDTPYLLYITGESFGPSSVKLRVTIGGELCDVVAHDHSSLLCSAPAGMGDSNPVVVTLDTRSNIQTSLSVFAYDPPVVVNVLPNVADAAIGQNVQINGHNFGPYATPVDITVGGLKCLDAEWINDAALKCNVQSDTVGRKNMTIKAANQSSPQVYYEVDRIIELRCTQDFYGVAGEYCLPCYTASNTLPVCGDLVTFPCQVQGAKCPGGERDFDLTVSLSGFWRFNVSDIAQCHPLRVNRVSEGGPGCPIFSACEPAESCLGANRCAIQYRGERCQDCADRFYRANGVCIKCPDSPWAVVIVFVVAAIAALYIASLLNSKNINLALISIGMDWAQVVAMFARTRINWPALVKELFLLLSAFNFNLELIAPECAVPSITYAGKWLFVEGMPIFAWFLLCLQWFVKFMWKRYVLRIERKAAMKHWNEIIATGVVVQRVLYLYVTRTTLDVYNCSPTDPPDYDSEGKQISYMAWNLSIRCNEPGGTHLFLQPFAFFAMALYVVGLPVLAIAWLWKNKEAVKYDQILRARITGDTKITNPHFEFRNTWKALYMNYRPGTWYWEFVICVRKFLIAFCSLSLRSTPSFQLAIALLVLFVAYIMQVRSLPYLSHARADSTAEESKRKALEGNEIHKRILAAMKSDANRYRSTSADTFEFAQESARGQDILEKFYAPQRTKFQQDLFKIRPLILKNKIANFIFDYNTAEAVLLSSAILINLAGICFDSSRFLPAKMGMPGIKQEYDSLAYAILVVMFFTIIFWFVSMIFDIILVTAPEMTHNILEFIEKRAGNVAEELKMRRDHLIKKRNKREKKDEVLNQVPEKKTASIVVPSLETGDVVQIQNPMLAKKREQTALVATKDAMAIVRARTALIKPPEISPRPKPRAVVESDSEDSSGAEDYPKPPPPPQKATTIAPPNTAASTGIAAAAPPAVPTTTGPTTSPRIRHVKEESDDDDDEDDE
jgi:hypothetical protein